MQLIVVHAVQSLVPSYTNTRTHNTAHNVSHIHKKWMLTSLPFLVAHYHRGVFLLSCCCFNYFSSSSSFIFCYLMLLYPKPNICSVLYRIFFIPWQRPRTTLFQLSLYLIRALDGSSICISLIRCSVFTFTAFSSDMLLNSLRTLSCAQL